MENTLRMPSSYCVMSEQEMTYTDGGATTAQALCAWFLPFYGWYKGTMAIRDYRRSHPDNWLETGLDALSADMETSTVNMLYDIACAISVVSVCASVVGLIPTALIALS